MPLQTDHTLVRPKCGEFITLTECLAAPLLAATRAQYDQQLANQAEAFSMDLRNSEVYQMKAGIALS
jgi:hypothetical protein